MPGHLEFEFRPASHSNPTRQRSDTNLMRILLCGDFSGRGNRTINNPVSLATRSAARIDIDNLEAVIARFAPAVNLSDDGANMPVEISCFDDFHPDNLLNQLDIFKRLRELRVRLLDPSQFQQASAELLGDNIDSGEDALQSLMGGNQPDKQSTSSSNNPATGIDALLQSIVAPHIVASSGREQEQFVRAIDSSIAEQMRLVLHNPGFQALESLWRSVQFLVTRLELDEALQLHVFDVSRTELEATAAEPDIEQSGLWKALVDRQQDATGGPGWSMVIALEAFDASKQDVMTLASLASIAAGAGAPVVATAAPMLYGCDKLQSTSDHHDWQAPDPENHPHWLALRRSALASWIGLVTPGLLLRLPYGEKTDPVDHFEFEEMAKADHNNVLLWAHSGAACALLAGTAFTESGSPLAIDQAEIDDLPAWIYEENGERRLFPCAETWLSDAAARWLMSEGMMVLASRRDRPAAQLMRWQSIAEPAKPLAGMQ